MSNGTGIPITEGIIFSPFITEGGGYGNKGITCYIDNENGNGNYCTTNGPPLLGPPVWREGEECYAIRSDNIGACIFKPESGTQCTGVLGTLNGENDGTLYCKNIKGQIDPDLLPKPEPEPEPVPEPEPEPICKKATCEKATGFELSNVDQYEGTNLPCYCQIGIRRPCPPTTFFSEKLQTCAFQESG